MASQRHAQASNEGGTHMKLWSAEGRRRCASEILEFLCYIVLACKDMQGTSTGITKGVFAGTQRIHPQSSKGGRAGKEIDSHA